MTTFIEGKECFSFLFFQESATSHRHTQTIQAAKSRGLLLVTHAKKNAKHNVTGYYNPLAFPRPAQLKLNLKMSATQDSQEDSVFYELTDWLLLFFGPF